MVNKRVNINKIRGEIYKMIIISKQRTRKIVFKAIFITLFIFLLYPTSLIISQNFKIPENFELPIGYKIIENSDGSITIIGTSDNELKINNNIISLSPNSKLKINKDNNEISIDGSGLIILNKGQENEEDFGEIKNAKIRLESDNLIFADFVSTSNKKYVFEYSREGQNLRYTYNAKKGGRVFFDPENELKGKDTTLIIENIDDAGFVKDRIEINGDFQLMFENGKSKELILENGVLKLSIFGKGTQEITASGKLSVFFDSRVIENFDGNAISIVPYNKKIAMKGQITIKNLKDFINYKGIGKDTYTDFYFEGMLGDPRKISYFNVAKGAVEVDNGKHNVLLDGDKWLMKVKHENKENPTPFIFEATNNLKSNERKIITIDEPVISENQLEDYHSKFNNVIKVSLDEKRQDNVIMYAGIKSYKEMDRLMRLNPDKLIIGGHVGIQSKKEIISALDELEKFSPNLRKSFRGVYLDPFLSDAGTHGSGIIAINSYGGRVSESTLIHEASHAFDTELSKSLDGIKFREEWISIAGDVYKRPDASSRVNKIGTWADGTFGPRYGVIRHYGSESPAEDIATFVEASYETSTIFKDLIDTNNQKYDERYMKKINLLSKYGFITSERYKIITGKDFK